MCEHLGVSALTGKRVKGDNDSAIKEHHLFCNHSSGFDDFSILASNNNDFKVTLMESLLINRDHPPFNKNRHSLPLELFDDWGTSFYHMIAVDWSDCSQIWLKPNSDTELVIRYDCKDRLYSFNFSDFQSSVVNLLPLIHADFIDKRIRQRFTNAEENDIWWEQGIVISKYSSNSSDFIVHFLTMKIMMTMNFH